MRTEIFIPASYLKERYGVNSNIPDDKITPVIKTTQDIKFLPILGTGLYERLQTGITNADLTANETGLLDNYICVALAHYTIAELPMVLGYQLWNKGLLKKTSDNSELPSATEMATFQTYHLDKAEWYANRLVRYLRQNATTFPLYLNPGSGYDTIFPENTSYSCPIYLGTDAKYDPGFIKKTKPDWER